MFEIDLDKILQQSASSSDESNRIFYNDVFISHRQFDKPMELIRKLTNEGLRVAWDHDLDLRDRRVIKAVSRAMSASYYLALYVSESFESSLWCKAEYTSALRCEKHSSNPRIIIVLQNESSRSKIPSELETHPCFIAGENLEALAAYLLEGNVKNTEFSSYKTRKMQLETDLLSDEEALNLLEQRLEYWIDSAGQLVNVSNTEQTLIRLMESLGAPHTELEDILREVRVRIIGSVGDYERAHSIEVLKKLASIARLVARSLDNNVVSQTAKKSASFVYDYMLCPLLCAVINDATRFDSRQAYESICQELSKSSEADLVPIFRRVAESVVLEPKNIKKILSRARIESYRVRER